MTFNEEAIMSYFRKYGPKSIDKAKIYAKKIFNISGDDVIRTVWNLIDQNKLTFLADRTIKVVEEDIDNATDPPVPPPVRLIADVDYEFCPYCGSGMAWSWKKFRKVCRANCLDGGFIPKLQLGVLAKDRKTGFEGIAVCYIKYLGGKEQYCLRSKSDEDARYFDAKRLKVIGRGILE